MALAGHDTGMKPASNPLAGPALMVLTMALYVANDSLVKWLGAHMPLGAIISLRGLFIIAILLGLIMVMPGHGPRSLVWTFRRPVLVRSLWDTAVTFLYLFALLHMPIANVLAIMNLSPLVILLLAAWRLGERLSGVDILAVVIGMTGGLLVVHPGAQGFDLWALSAFAAMIGVAGRDVVTRTIPEGAPSLVIALSNVLLIQLGGFALWAMQAGDLAENSQSAALFTMQTWIMLFAAAVFLSAAYVLIVIAVRLAPLARTAPWRYTIVLWGVLAGWLVFGEWPDALAMTGIVLIVIGAWLAGRHVFQPHRPQRGHTR